MRPWGGFNQHGRRFAPIMDFLRAYYSSNRVVPTITIPIISEKWIIEEVIRANYNADRRRLLALSDLRSDNQARIYTPRAGENCYPTRGAKLSTRLDKRNKLSPWATQRSTSERYVRGVCRSELQLRSDTAAAINFGWKPVDAFEVPNPAPGGVKVNTTLPPPQDITGQVEGAIRTANDGYEGMNNVGQPVVEVYQPGGISSEGMTTWRRTPKFRLALITAQTEPGRRLLVAPNTSKIGSPRRGN